MFSIIEIGKEKILVFICLMLSVFVNTNAEEEKCIFDLGDKITQYVLEYLYDTAFYNGGHNEKSFSCYNRIENQEYFTTASINNSPRAISKIIRLYNGIQKLDTSEYTESKLKIYNILKGIVYRGYDELYIYDGYVYSFENEVDREFLENKNERYAPEYGEEFSHMVRISIQTGSTEDIDLGIPIIHNEETYLGANQGRYRVIYYDDINSILTVGYKVSARVYGTNILGYYKMNLKTGNLDYFPEKEGYCTNPINRYSFQENGEIVSVVRQAMFSRYIVTFSPDTLLCTYQAFEGGFDANGDVDVLQDYEIISAYKRGELKFIDSYQ